MKFIKQSLTSHKIDLETLKLQIKAAQFESERLSTLLTEFLDIKKSKSQSSKHPTILESTQIPIEIPRRTRSKATEEEANRLQPLVEQIGIPTTEKIEAVARELNWNNKKVRNYVTYRRNLRKGKSKD